MVEYIEARAIVTSNYGIIDVETFHNRTMEHCPDRGCTFEDVTTLVPSGKDWFLHFPQVNNNLEEVKPFANILTGILYVELVYTSTYVNIGTQPFGAIIFTCNPIVRDKLLNAARIDTALFMRPTFGVKFVAFTIDATIQMNEHVERTFNAFRFEFKHMKLALMNSLQAPQEPYLRQADVSNVWHVSYWAFTSFLNTWKDNQCLYRYLPQVSDNGNRHLNVDEFLWVFHSTMLRWKKTKLVDVESLKLALSNVTVVEGERSADTSDKDNADERYWIIARSCDVFEKAQHHLQRLLERRMECIKIGAEISKQLEDIRRTFYAHQLAAEELIHNIMYKIIETAPTNIFDPMIMKVMVSNALTTIERMANPALFYGSVIKDISPEINECVLKTYGYVNKCSKIQYSFIHITKLKTLASAVKTKPSPLVTDEKYIGCYDSIQFYYDNPVNDGAAKTLAYMGQFGSIVYQVNGPKGVTFGTFSPVANSTAYSTIDECLTETLLQPYVSEIVTSTLDITTIVLDVDLKPLHCTLDITKTSKDMENLVNIVFNKLVHDLQLIHYVFFSATDNAANSKYGFHHHIRLPEGWAAAHEFVEQLVHILGVMRYLFRNTIGVDCGQFNDYVYDTAIYAATKGNDRSVNENRVRFHGLRMPFHTKSDNTCRLNCVYRSDGRNVSDEIPINHLFVHSDNSPGRLTGKVLLHIRGIQSISDIEYAARMQTSITNNYVRTECAFKASNLIDAVNSRCLIIEDSKTMLAVLNELWFRKGKASMRQVLLKTKGDNGSSYPYSIIEDAINGSRIILTPERTFSVISNDSKHFPICPVRVHNNPHKGGVRINVFTSPKMTRFGFVVNSFKQTCKNKHLYDVKMNMDETFVAQVIREKLEDRFSRLNRPEFIIYEAIREEQQNNTEYDGFIDEPVSEISWLAVENPVSL
jgi:hypothetical protein